MYIAHEGNLLYLVRLWKEIEAGIVKGKILPSKIPVILQSIL